MADIKKWARRTAVKQVAKRRENIRLAREWNDPTSKMTIGQRVKGAMLAAGEDRLRRSGLVGNVVQDWREEIERPLANTLRNSALNFAQNRMGTIGQIGVTAFYSSYYTKLDANLITRSDIDGDDLPGTIERIDRKHSDAHNDLKGKLRRITDEINTKVNSINTQLSKYDDRFKRLESRMRELEMSSKNKDGFQAMNNDWTERFNQMRPGNMGIGPQQKQENGYGVGHLLGAAALGRWGGGALRMMGSMMRPLMLGGAARLAGAALLNPYVLGAGALMGGGYLAYRYFNSPAQAATPNGAPPPNNQPNVPGQIPSEIKTDNFSVTATGDITLQSQKDIKLKGRRIILNASEVIFEAGSITGLKGTKPGNNGGSSNGLKNPGLGMGYDPSGSPMMGTHFNNPEIPGTVFSPGAGPGAREFLGKGPSGRYYPTPGGGSPSSPSGAGPSTPSAPTAKPPGYVAPPPGSTPTPSGRPSAPGMAPAPVAPPGVIPSAPPAAFGAPSIPYGPIPVMPYGPTVPATPFLAPFAPGGQLPSWVPGGQAPTQEFPSNGFGGINPKQMPFPMNMPGQSGAVPSGDPNQNLGNASTANMQRAVYEAFRSRGFSHSAAIAMTGEVGRENSYRTGLIFGEHGDPANRATNVGLFSFQKERRDQLYEHLRAGGHLDEKGKIKTTRGALESQIDFITKEMESGSHTSKNSPRAERVRDMLNKMRSGEIDMDEAHRVIGKDYIRWRYDDPAYAHHKRAMSQHERNLQANLNRNPYEAPGAPIKEGSVPGLFPGFDIDKFNKGQVGGLPMPPGTRIPQGIPGSAPPEMPAQKNMLMLDGMWTRGGRFDGENKRMAEEIAKRHGYNPVWMNMDPRAGGAGSPQVKAVIERLKQGDINSLFGFSAGAYNIPHIINHPEFKKLPEAIRNQLTHAWGVGAPGVDYSKLGSVKGQHYEPHDLKGYLGTLPEQPLSRPAIAQTAIPSVSDNPNFSAIPRREDGTPITGPLPGKQEDRPKFFGGGFYFGDDKHTEFGTGPAKYGSLPRGFYPLTGPHHGRVVPDGIQINHNMIRDEKFNRTKIAAVIHASQSLRTEGCIGIHPSQWPSVKAKIYSLAKTHGWGNVYLHVDKNADGKYFARVLTKDQLPANYRVMSQDEFMKTAQVVDPDKYEQMKKAFEKNREIGDDPRAAFEAGKNPVMPDFKNSIVTTVPPGGEAPPTPTKIGGDKGWDMRKIDDENTDAPGRSYKTTDINLLKSLGKEGVNFNMRDLESAREGLRALDREFEDKVRGAELPFYAAGADGKSPDFGYTPKHDVFGLKGHKVYMPKDKLLGDTEALTALQNNKHDRGYGKFDPETARQLWRLDEFQRNGVNNGVHPNELEHNANRVNNMINESRPSLIGSVAQMMGAYKAGTNPLEQQLRQNLVPPAPPSSFFQGSKDMMTQLRQNFEALTNPPSIDPNTMRPIQGPGGVTSDPQQSATQGENKPASNPATTPPPAPTSSSDNSRMDPPVHNPEASTSDRPTPGDIKPGGAQSSASILQNTQ